MASSAMALKRHVLTIVIVTMVLGGALFAVGAYRSSTRLVAHRAEREAVRELRASAASRIAGTRQWYEELSANDEIGRVFALRVGHEEPRLAFVRAVTALAEASGIENLTLQERNEISEDPEDVPLHEAEALGSLVPAAYRFTAEAPYGAIVRFLNGLDDLPHVVDLRHASMGSVRDELRVELELVTYGSPT